MKAVLNIALYQAAWFCCVLWGNAGALYGLLPVLFHLVLSDQRTADLRMIAFLLFLGMVADGTWYQLGFMELQDGGFPLPPWLMVIWIALAITPHHSLAWMKGRPFVAMIFGGIGGPLAYWAGVKLDAAEFNYPVLPSLVFLSVLWAVLWGAVMYFASRSGRTNTGLPGRAGQDRSQAD